MCRQGCQEYQLSVLAANAAIIASSTSGLLTVILPSGAFEAFEYGYDIRN